MTAYLAYIDELTPQCSHVIAMMRDGSIQPDAYSTCSKHDTEEEAQEAIRAALLRRFNLIQEALYEERSQLLAEYARFISRNDDIAVAWRKRQQRIVDEVNESLLHTQCHIAICEESKFPVIPIGDTYADLL